MGPVRTSSPGCPAQRRRPYARVTDTIGGDVTAGRRSHRQQPPRRPEDTPSRRAPARHPQRRFPPARNGTPSRTRPHANRQGAFCLRTPHPGDERRSVSVPALTKRKHVRVPWSWQHHRHDRRDSMSPSSSASIATTSSAKPLASSTRSRHLGLAAAASMIRTISSPRSPPSTVLRHGTVDVVESPREFATATANPQDSAPSVIVAVDSSVFDSRRRHLFERVFQRSKRPPERGAMRTLATSAPSWRARGEGPIAVEH